MFRKFFQTLLLITFLSCSLSNVWANEWKDSVSKGDEARRVGDYKNAIIYYQETLKLKSMHVIERATTHNNLAGVYSSMAKYELAEYHFKEALAIVEKVVGQNHRFYISSLNGLGLVYKRQGQFDKAQPIYIKVRAIAAKISGKKSKQYATFTNNLGALYYTKRDYAKAMPLYQEAIAIRETLNPPDPLGLMESLNAIAVLYNSTGQPHKSEPILKRNLKWVKNHLGAKHPYIGMTLNHLASSYFSQKRFEEAELTQNQAVALMESAIGASHPDVIRYKENLKQIKQVRKEHSQ